MTGNKLYTAGGTLAFVVVLVGIKIVTRTAVSAALGPTPQVEPVHIPYYQPPVSLTWKNPAAAGDDPDEPKGTGQPRKPTSQPNPDAAKTNLAEFELNPGAAAKAGLVRQWTAPSEGKFKPNDLLNP